MNRSDDLLSVLTEEHRELHQLMTELEHLTGHERLRRSLAELAIAEMVRHSVAEEAYLYPVARERLPEGPQLIDQHLAEHEKIEQTLKRLESPDITDAEFSLLLSQLDAYSYVHRQSEEGELFPLMAEHLSIEELTALGRKAVEAREKASVQQYLSGADRTPQSRILASGTSLAERVRAYLRSTYPL